MFQPQSPVTTRSWPPTPFACAVAALTALEDMTEEDIGGLVFLTKPAVPGWRVWARVTNWQVDEGNTLFGNFEVREGATATPGARLLSVGEPTTESFAWADEKVQQFEALMKEARQGEHSLVRWVAAMVDVMPLKHMPEALRFGWSAARDEAELSAGNVVMRVGTLAGGDGWRLEANQRLGGMEPATRMVPAGCNENEALLDVLVHAWIYGRRHD